MQKTSYEDLVIDCVMPVWITQEDTLDLTKNAIHSLGKVRLIIVDNASTLGGGYLRSVADVYIRNQTNLGFAKAINQGLKVSNSKLKACVNNDTRISPNWQDVARDTLITESVYSCHFRMTDYDTPFAYGDKTYYHGKERWCTTSFFVINAEKALFYFDENYLNSYDDWDYWYTVRKAGLQTAYTNKACYQHQHSHTQKLIPEREANDKKNKEYFKDKWGDCAENLFERDFPEQMKQDYWGGFAL